MVRAIPYLAFDGNCREAMEFYQRCLGGNLSIMKVGDGPGGENLPPAAREKVMHAQLEVGSVMVMAADYQGEGKPVAGTKVCIMLDCETEEEIRRVHADLSAGGQIGTPLAEQFWGAVYGDFTDRYGIGWMVNWDKPLV